MDSIKQLLRMGKQRICFDVDNSLANLSGAMLPKINRMFHANYSLHDITSSWDWMEKTLHVDRSYFWLLYNDAWAHYESLEPLVSQEEMLELAAHYTIDFVTSKESLDTVPSLVKWLQRNFPKHKGGLFIVDIGEDKADLAYSLYADDSPHLAESIGKRDGKLLYLVQYGHNTHIGRSDRVIPVENTHVAVRELISLAREAEKPDKVMVPT
jgi:5'(3')-deoxyribonucleotidase